MTELETYLADCLQKLHQSDVSAVHEGLQRLDGMIANLCSRYSQSRSRRNTPPATRVRKPTPKSESSKSHRTVWKLPTVDDAVFGEFVELQNGFEFNLANALVHTLPRMTSDPGEFPSESMVLVHTVLQGVLLIHPPSRSIFMRESNLQLILDCIISGKQSAVVKAAVRTLVSCLVRSVPNIRTFEKLDGPEVMCKLLKKSNPAVPKEVKVGVLEFLFFYLVPETKTLDNRHGNDSQDVPTSQADPPQRLGYDDGYIRRNTEDKASILRCYLPNVDDLVQELYESKPFGNMDIEW